LTPIICIGETMAEKSEGRAEAVLEMQVNITLRDVPPERLPDVILAYEPRWAIGQKEAAAPDYIQMAHAFIRRHLVSRYGQDAVSQTRVIYGGSVTVENAGDIISQPDVDGLFVGRAALDPGGFAGIVQIVAVEAGRRSA
ncbi:MAG: triose-phosphate isomerase, partial [Anaerolineae bacterium]|nr:triose-phosphate isomerase [Anaerolineae bacterium]